MRTFTPININIIPPKISDLFFKKQPNFFPTKTPKRDRENVTTPIVITVGTGE